MKKFLCMILLIPFIGISQAKTVVSVTRVFPKADKVAEFEKALAVTLTKLVQNGPPNRRRNRFEHIVHCLTIGKL